MQIVCVYIEQSNWIYLLILFTFTYIHNTRILPCWKTKTRPHNINSLAQQHFLLILIYLSLSWGSKRCSNNCDLQWGLFCVSSLGELNHQISYCLVWFLYLIFSKSIWIHGYLTIQKLEHSYWNFKIFLRNT